MTAGNRIGYTNGRRGKIVVYLVVLIVVSTPIGFQWKLSACECRRYRGMHLRILSRPKGNQDGGQQEVCIRSTYSRYRLNSIVDHNRPNYIFYSPERQQQQPTSERSTKHTTTKTNKQKRKKLRSKRAN